MMIHQNPISISYKVTQKGFRNCGRPKLIEYIVKPQTRENLAKSVIRTSSQKTQLTVQQ